MPEQDISIVSLRGGQNDTSPPNELADDMCQLAQNVEFFASDLGERRAGCDPISITGSGLDQGAGTVIVHLSQWFPTNDPTLPEFWAVSAVPNVSIVFARRDTSGVWHTVVPVEAAAVTEPDIYQINTQALDGLLFVSYHTSVGGQATDRMHVWDGTTLRPTGLSQPGMPTVANTAVAGTYSGTRYFREREVVQTAGVVTLRSEPSLSNQFTPDGAHDGAIITKSATQNSNATHWEVEASEDNALFYRIATVAIGTSTYTDHTAFATGYSSNPLSEAIGAYLTQRAMKYLAADGDRLLMGSHWFDPTAKSTVSWSPVLNDPGVGNTERQPIVTTGGLAITTSLNLDNYSGGPLTGISSGVNGVWYAFKWDHIYQLTRTGDVTAAYQPITLSTARGAIPGSIFSGMDENGSPCLYLLDPMMGPSRLGGGGLQVIVGLRGTWNRINLHALKVKACGAYYPFKQQAWWMIPVDGADRPNLGLKLQVSELRSLGGSTGSFGGSAVSRGWSTVTGRITNAYCMSVFTEFIPFPLNGVFSLSQRPFIGLTTPDFIQRCDVDSTDAGVAYSAIIITGPRFVSSLLQRWGGMTGTLLATALAGQTIFVRFIRDFGVETSAAVSASLAPVGSESLVIKDFDNLVMSGNRALQVQFSDS
jgi:hypothetical protein